MRRLFIFLLATAGTLKVAAQNISPESDFAGHHNDYVSPRHHKEKKHKPAKPPRVPRPVRAPRVRREPVFLDNSSGWSIEGNALAGLFTRNINATGLAAGYANPVNSNISNPKFNNGGSYGLDAEVSYFFGKRRHFGIGTGVMYLYNRSNVTVDNFHTEYQSYDAFGNTFRQELTSDGQIREKWGASGFNVPLLLKYKTRFSKHLGFSADAGVVLNVSENIAYKTNSAFNYEAVYQYATGEGGNVTTVYDPSTPPAANDLVITQSQYAATHTAAQTEAYFNSLRAQGYNVGLDVSPNNNKGHVTFNNGSLGILLRPAVNIYFTDNLTLNVGVWYLYQDVNNSAVSNYRITDKVGTYNAMLNGVSNIAGNSFGVSAGVRYAFPKARCWEEPPVAPAANDETTESAPAPVEPAPVPTPPEEITETEPETYEHVDISTPLLFDVDRTTIKRSSYPVLREAIRELKEKPNAYLVIHGYTDNTGSVAYNKKLSMRRAQAVKSYLRHHGVRYRTIQTIGHGESHPAASNATSRGRAKNRRAVMKLKNGGSKKKKKVQEAESMEDDD